MDREQVEGADEEAAGGELARQADVAGVGGVQVHQAVDQDRVHQEAAPPARGGRGSYRRGNRGTSKDLSCGLAGRARTHCSE